MKYRREIDGLRALAVLSVIFYHAGLPFFKGGFVGVDVFFVISGYLITSIIVNEMKRGVFSLGDFYGRRARRILPALFFMMLCTFPLSWIWMLPKEFKEYSASLVFVPLFISNVLFYLQSGYFDVAAELRPLLHTWSLAVEEQYYLIFPLFLLLTWRLGKKWVLCFIVLAILLSLVLAQWAANVHPTANFYLLPTRLFEILIGSLLGWHIQHKVDDKFIGQLGSFIGLLLILVSIFIFDKNTPYPSLYTLAPIVGTCLILIFSSEKNPIGVLLGCNILVGIGLISYSSYLWHQPIFSFYRIRGLDLSQNGIAYILIVVALVIGWLSWKYVETPARTKKNITTKKLCLMSLGFSLVFIIAGYVGYASNGLLARYSPNQKQILSYLNYDLFSQGFRPSRCFMEPADTYRSFSDECYGKHSSDAYLIWGDSHAAALSQGMRLIHEDTIQLTASACPPLIDVDFNERANCRSINEFIKSKIIDLRPRKIFLSANWRAYVHEDIFQGLIRTINFIKVISPKTEIIIVGNVPWWTPELPILMLKNGYAINKPMFLKLDSYESIEKLDILLQKLSDANGVRFFSALNSMCINNECAAVITYRGEFWLTAFDNAHLTEAGAYYIFNEIENNKRLWN